MGFLKSNCSHIGNITGLTDKMCIDAFCNGKSMAPGLSGLMEKRKAEAMKGAGNFFDSILGNLGKAKI